MHRLSVPIFELGDSQVLINISEIKDQPFLPQTDNMNIQPVSLWFLPQRKQYSLGPNSTFGLEAGITTHLDMGKFF